MTAAYIVTDAEIRERKRTTSLNTGVHMVYCGIGQVTLEYLSTDIVSFANHC